MLKEVLTRMLSDKQIAAGMSLEEDTDFVYLKYGDTEERFNAHTVTPSTIRNTADLLLAGVEIKQVIDKCEHHN